MIARQLLHYPVNSHTRYILLRIRNLGNHYFRIRFLIHNQVVYYMLTGKDHLAAVVADKNNQHILEEN